MNSYIYNIILVFLSILHLSLIDHSCYSNENFFLSFFWSKLPILTQVLFLFFTDRESEGCWSRCFALLQTMERNLTWTKWCNRCNRLSKILVSLKSIFSPFFFHPFLITEIHLYKMRKLNETTFHRFNVLFFIKKNFKEKRRQSFKLLIFLW